jgi:hypothetical protein
MCTGRPYARRRHLSPRALPPSAVLARHLQGVGTATCCILAAPAQ